MIRLLKGIIVATVINGCSDIGTEKIDTGFTNPVVEPDPNQVPLVCVQEEFDSSVEIRIVYGDETKSPYKRGAVKIVGDTWISQGITDDNGVVVLGVKGDSRFILSAYSPYGDYIFYAYDTPLIVPQFSTSVVMECEYDTEIVTCYDNNIIVPSS